MVRQVRPLPPSSPIAPGLSSGLRRFRAVVRLLAVAAIALGLLLPVVGEAVRAQQPAVVPVVTIDGPVTPAVADHVADAIAGAGDDDAPAVLLRIETGSGTWVATDRILDAILDSRVPVLTWAPAGASVDGPGTTLLLAGDVAAMAPESRLLFDGAYGHTAWPFDDDTPSLDRAGELRALADLRGRPDDWVADAVASSAVLSAADAVRLGVIDGEAADPAALFALADGREADLAAGPTTIATAGAAPSTAEPGLLDRISLFLSQPTVAYLLLCFGAIGLFLELSSPGITVAGVGGLIALGLAAYLLAGMPLSWTGLAMIAVGLVLLVIDIFVPSLGLLTVGGLASFVVGSYVLFDGEGTAGYVVNPIAIWVVTACLVVFFVFLAGSVLKSMRRRPVSGRESMVGRVGEARTPLAPEGLIFIDGETWRAHAMTLHRSAAAPIIAAGTPVIVTRIDGLLLEVRAATPAEARPGGDDTPPDRRAVVPVGRAAAMD